MHKTMEKGPRQMCALCTRAVCRTAYVTYSLVVLALCLNTVGCKAMGIFHEGEEIYSVFGLR